MTISATTQGLKPGVCTSSNRPANPFDGQVISETDTDSLKVYNGTSWIGVGYPLSLFREEQAAGTYGGTATSGSWITRTLNTTVVNNITGCSLASNQVTLAAGTYFVTGLTPSYGGVGAVQSRIYNVTDSAAIGYGLNNPNGHASSGCISTVNYYFTFASSKTIALQMRVAGTVGTDGLGGRTNWGNVEVYSELMIARIA